MQAITTKYLGPTTHRDARIKARAAAGSVVIPYPYHLTGQAAHRAAAQALADRSDLKWLGGGLPTKDGYAFVAVHAWSEA
jgi:hypothetical protein